ncbi:hypothetical protein ABZ942_15510 [Nocardia sp. NPDC046473]|uniref:hypothetical protein n=1 Tax=Nocardia sp. NPDC046473 TaxID=3155733 RepID=UPI0033E8E713
MNDPYAGLDPFVRQALESWTALSGEQRDYAIGFACQWAPDVITSASEKAVQITAVDEQLMRLEAQQ